MFFGSAMTNFGVQPFLEKYLELAPPPEPRKTLEGTVAPEDPNFSAFVFKIQANMDPKHHDRVAFMRICSGVFEKGASVLHRQSGKMIRLSQPQQFLATERQTVEKAYPGDIIGVFDTGELGVGDTVCEKKHPVTFIDFPVFPPELFARLSPVSSMKRKQFLNGVTQLAQEGAIQVYKQPYIMESFIIGAVGQLQFEVMKYRLENEYNVSVNLEPLGFTAARWTEGDVPPEELVASTMPWWSTTAANGRCTSCQCLAGRLAGPEKSKSQIPRKPAPGCGRTGRKLIKSSRTVDGSAAFLHSGKRRERISRLYFMPYSTEREIQSLMNVKVQAPFDAVGIGTSAVLSSIPEG